MPDKVVISQLSKTKAGTGLFLGSCLVAFIYWAILTPTPTMTLTQYFVSRGSSWTFMGLIGLGANTVTLAFVVSLALQLLNGAAVWIQDNQIIYINKFFMSARLNDIRRVTVGVYGKYSRTGIILTLDDGEEKVIPAGLLSEGPLVVATRLNKYLGVAPLSLR